MFNVAAHMVALSPVLSKRLRVVEHAARIGEEKTNSVHQVVTADALGNLGSNPSCVIFDEVLTQPVTYGPRCGSTWAPRVQPLLLAATAAGNDPTSFAKSEHD
ncbi:hypothetical protein [Amycolatopsis sp. MJM2582]|uniref:hypothetical protein n=1 Tax=Amycolatopsis sp. MJM2582 TaxID=1427749 RepID=UPI00068D21CD|nr:hypothetical protein [Amycolatopsis sp. MJM2582]